MALGNHIIIPEQYRYAINPKIYKRTHYIYISCTCIAVFCCVYLLTGLPIFFRDTSLALWRNNHAKTQCHWSNPGERGYTEYTNLLRKTMLPQPYLILSNLIRCNDPSGQKCSKTWEGYGGESWFVGEGRDLKFWCDLLKFSLFHSPISVAPRAVKQSNSSSDVNMLVFSNTWGNMCKYLYISV